MSQPDDDVTRLLNEVRREFEEKNSNTETANEKFGEFIKAEKKSFLQMTHEKMKRFQINIGRISLDDE